MDPDGRVAGRAARASGHFRYRAASPD